VKVADFVTSLRFSAPRSARWACSGRWTRQPKAGSVPLGAT